MTETREDGEETPGWSTGWRPAYGSTLEIDYIVSLELGSSNDIANLFRKGEPVLKPHGQRCISDLLIDSQWDTRPWRIMAREGRNGRYTWFVRIGRHVVLKKSLRIYE